MHRLLLSLVAVSGCALAQSNPVSAIVKAQYTTTKNNIARSAEKVPENLYSFKPTDAVRSFGQLVGHVADAQYTFCAIALGEKDPAPGIEKTKTSKADLAQALKDSYAYCDKAYDGMTDAKAAELVKLFGRDAARLGALTGNNMHNHEHYGNMVTYMRLKNIVPPSSEPR